MFAKNLVSILFVLLFFHIREDKFFLEALS